MDFNTTTVAGPVLPGLCTANPCDDDLTPEACLDLEYAADHPELCPNSSPITGLVVVPADGQCEVGRFFPFWAFLTFASGDRKDVTTLVSWLAGNASVASIAATGEATGLSEGQTTIQASYRGLFAFSQLTVIPLCVSSGIDFALVFDRSGSMREVGTDGRSRMEGSLLASRALVANIDYEKDKAAVISFGGFFHSAYGPPAPSVTMHTTLVANKADTLSAINTVQVICDAPDPNNPSVNIFSCGTGIGGGLLAAYDELKSERHVPGSRRTVVVLTDGQENICNPDPITIATQMRNEGFDIVVIALAIEDGPQYFCAHGYSTIYEYLQAISTCDLFYTAPTVEDLPNIYANIPSSICQGENDNPCFYYPY
jgi:hypothetical protein